MPIWRKTEGQLWRSEGKLVRGVDCEKWRSHWYTGEQGDGEADHAAFRWRNIRIVDYVDGDLAACSDCTDTTSYPAWNGTFYPATTHDPLGHLTRLDWGVLAYQWHPNRLNIGSKWLNAQDPWWLNPTWVCLQKIAGVCKYTMSIGCVEMEGDYHKENHLIWFGEKVLTPFTCAGLEPVGTYTRTGGCDTTDELALEYVP